MNSQHSDENSRWITLLSLTADQCESPAPPALAPWFLASRGKADLPKSTPRHLDEILWHALAAGQPPPSQTVGSLKIDSAAPAPLAVMTAEDTIEVWTERELSSLHALWGLAHRDDHRDWLDRVRGACGWHLERTEPDNATGRPWAVHVFAWLWMEDGVAEGRLYAETLLHNCQTLDAKPDPLSAEILRDASGALQSLVNTKTSSQA